MLISHYMCTAIIGFAHGRVKKCIFLTVNVLRRVLLRIGNDSFVLDVVAIFKHRVLPVTHAHLKNLAINHLDMSVVVSVQSALRHILQFLYSFSGFMMELVVWITYLYFKCSY